MPPPRSSPASRAAASAGAGPSETNATAPSRSKSSTISRHSSALLTAGPSATRAGTFMAIPPCRKYCGSKVPAGADPDQPKIGTSQFSRLREELDELGLQIPCRRHCQPTGEHLFADIRRWFHGRRRVRGQPTRGTADPCPHGHWMVVAQGTAARLARKDPRCRVCGGAPGAGALRPTSGHRGLDEKEVALTDTRPTLDRVHQRRKPGWQSHGTGKAKSVTRGSRYRRKAAHRCARNRLTIPLRRRCDSGCCRACRGTVGDVLSACSFCFQTELTLWLE